MQQVGWHEVGIELDSCQPVLFDSHIVIIIVVVEGKCVIEASTGRRYEADFTIAESNEMFTFRNFPQLDKYGKSVSYYCKVTTTKDHKFPISYKI